MARLVLVLVSSLIAQPLLANPCGFVQRRVIKRANNVYRVQKVQKVQQVYDQPYVAQEQYHYFVGAPAGLGYGALQQAHYGQIERQMQRLQDRLADLKDAQQYQQQPYQQYHAPQQYAPPLQYAPPQQQYVAPQQQQQCQACQAPQPIQQQQQPCQACAVQPQFQQQQPQTLPAPQGSQFTQHPPVLQQACAQCHTGSTAKGGFDVGNLSQMSADERLQAMKKATSGEMPKGQSALTDEQLGQLSTELFSPAEQRELVQMLRESMKGE